LLGLTAFAGGAAEGSADHRAWQHGIDLIPVGGRLLVVWGSPGNPPRANPGGRWQHDIYYAWLNPGTAHETAAVEPRILVSRPEAQEPPSAAINAGGTILITAEDGNRGINQQAGLWDSSLQALRRYPFLIRRGGHSGHVASMGERFLIVYGEGWVNGGGWQGRGTGKNVFARVAAKDGKLGREVRLNAQGVPVPRNSWPLVAGSERNWLAVWQSHPAIELQSALVAASGKVVARNRIIGGLPLRYAYAVEYSRSLGAYVIAGSSGEGGFVSLVNLRGEVVKTQTGLPPMAAESRLILGSDGAEVIGVYPVRPRGIAVVRLSANSVDLEGLVDHPYAWDYTGTTGIFVAPRRVLFVTLSKAGLQRIPVDLPRR
jgi:hypothetical protein